MVKVITIVVALAAGLGAHPAVPAGCGPGCAAAYRAIAQALPRDRSGALARAIVATPGFDYAELARTLRIPTTTEVRRGWPAFCRSHFPHDRAAARRCDSLLLRPSTPQGDGPLGI